MRYDTRREKELAELDPEGPIILPKRRGPVVITAKELERLRRESPLEPVGSFERELANEQDDEPNDLKRDERHENGEEDFDHLKRMYDLDW